MEEVAHGEVRLTADLRELEYDLKRAQERFTRTIRDLDRQSATAHVDLNTTKFDRQVKEAELELKRLKGLRADTAISVSEASAKKFDKQIEKAKLELDRLNGRKAEVQMRVKGTKETLADIAAADKAADAYADAEMERARKVDLAEEKYQRKQAARQREAQRNGMAMSRAEADAYRMLARERERVQREGMAMSRAEAAAYREQEATQNRLQRDGMSMARAEAAAHREEAARQRARTIGLLEEEATVARLQRQYANLQRKAERRVETNRVSRALNPAVRERVQLDEAEALAEMRILRAKLEAMGVKPIEIRTQVDEGPILNMIGNLGDLTVRLGPFTGSITQFGRAAMLLGPILIGLIGTVSALAGALGGALVGAAGLASAGLAGLVGIFGGMFLAVKPMMQQFKRYNQVSDAYTKAVEKFGAGSDKAKKALAQLHSTVQHLNPMVKTAVDNWKELKKAYIAGTVDTRRNVLSSMVEGSKTLLAIMPTVTRAVNTGSASVRKGLSGWFSGLRSARGQNIIGQIMDNTSKSIPPLMHGVGSLTAAFSKLIASFSRHLAPVATWFDHWASSVNKAADNTVNMNSRVDQLVDVFKQTVHFITAATRVLTAFFGAGIGPGGDLMQRMANSLNSMADGMNSVAGQGKLVTFFRESITTTEKLFQVLKPLIQLFIEFSSIMRPFTDIALSMVSPLAKITQEISNWGPLRAAVQGLFGLFLAAKVATTIGGIATSVGALTKALIALRAAAAAGDMSRIMSYFGKGRVAPMKAGERAVGVGAAEAATGAAAGSAIEKRVVKYSTRGGAVAAEAAGGAVAGEAAAGAAAGETAAAAALPTAAIGGFVVAVGAAVYGLHKLAQASNNTFNQQQRVAPHTFAPSNDPLQRPQGAYRGAPQQPQQGTAAARAAVPIVARDIAAAGDAMHAQGAATRQAADAYGQLAQAQLTVKEAEKQYGAAVKTSGVNSLGARQALQYLRDARRQETSAEKNWEAVAKSANANVTAEVNRYKHAIDAARKGKFDPRDVEVYRAALERARNSAAGVQVNLRRAMEGTTAITGKAAEAVGKFSRTFGAQAGFKRVVLQTEDAGAVTKIANLGNKLKELGNTRAVKVILNSADNPQDAIDRLNKALDRTERKRIADIKANTTPLKHSLDDATAQADKLDHKKVTPTAHLNKHPLDSKLDEIFGSQFPKFEHSNPTATAHINGSHVGDEMAAAVKKAKLVAAASAVNVPVNLVDALNKNVSQSTPKGGKGGGGDGTGPSGDGLGASLGRSARAFAAKKAKADPSKFLDSLFGGGGLGTGALAGSGLNAFNSIAERFGLTIGSGLRPGSKTLSGNTSYHAMGRARDFPGPPAAMLSFARYMAARFGHSLKELIHTPLGFGIKNGQRVPLSFWGAGINAQHQNHVHVAMAQGGRVPQRVTKPTVLYGEEPGHPEYFISTNPRDKKRSKALLFQAANEIGAFDGQYASGARRGGSGGIKLDKEQQSVFSTAISVAKSLGAGPKATKALIMALWDESGGHNLNHGDASSTGVLQLLSGTAKSLGVSARDVKTVIKLFLTKGFWKHGGAIKLARNNPKLSAAEIAHLVQGNKGGSAPYQAFTGKANATINKLLGAGGLGSDFGAPGTIPTLGATDTPDTPVTRAQALVTRAGLTPGNQDDIEAQVNLGYQLGEKIQQERVRLTKVNNALKGKLLKATRDRLLTEKDQLLNSIAEDQKARADAGTAATDQLFENRFGLGGGGVAELNWMQQNALSTPGTADDKTATIGLVGYWTEKLKAASAKGDYAGMTEASQNIKTFNDQIASIDETTFSDQNDANKAMAALTPGMQDDVDAAKEYLRHAQYMLLIAQKVGDNAGIAKWGAAVKSGNDDLAGIQDQMNQTPLNVATAFAALTPGLQDDVAAAQGWVDYWATMLNIADTPEKARTAAEGLGSAKGTLKQAQETAATLPIQRRLAIARLTTGTEDDKGPLQELVTYWQGVLDNAPDDQTAITAAENIKSYTDELNGITSTVAAQSWAIGTSRYDLYKSMGSNFASNVGPDRALYLGGMAAPGGAAGAGGGVNIEQFHANFPVAPTDAHTFAKGVEFELGAIV